MVRGAGRARTRTHLIPSAVPPTWADLSACGIERRPPPDELALGQRIVSWAGALIVRRRLMGRLFVGLTVFSAIFLFAATLLFVLLLPV